MFISDNSGRVVNYSLKSRQFIESFDYSESGQALRIPTGLAVFDEQLVIADSGNNRIVIADIDGKVVNSWGDYGSYGGQLASPSAVAVFGSTFLIADTINHRLQAFSSRGEFLFQWGRHPPTAHEGHGRIHYPSAIAVSRSGRNVMVCETIESRCQMFRDITQDDRIASVSDSSWWEKATRFHYGTKGTTVAACSGCHGGWGEKAKPTESASLEKSVPDRLSSLLIKEANADIDTYDKLVHEYFAVSEPDTHSVLLFLLKPHEKRGVKPKFVTRMGGRGTEYGKMIQPSGILFDPHKPTIWVSDKGNLRSQEFAFSQTPVIANDRSSWTPSEGQYNAKMSSGSGSSKFVRANVYRPNDMIDKRAKLPDLPPVGEPSAMTQLMDGTILMVDPPMGTVHVFDADMTYVRTWDDYGNGEQRMLKPLDIAADLKRNRVYVVDEYDFKIKVFDTRGHYLFAFGSAGAEAHQFVTPFGIAVDQDGDIFITDTAKNQIKKFSPDGEFIASWGVWGDELGQFYKPKGITAINNDLLIVLDFGNHRAQVLTTDGKFLSTFGIDENPNEINALSRR